MTAQSPYNFKIEDGDDMFYYLPGSVELPIESSKYWSGIWNSEYDIMTMSFRLYGDIDMYWVILESNNISNPYLLKPGDTFRVLLPDYTSEIRIING